MMQEAIDCMYFSLINCLSAVVKNYPSENSWWRGYFFNWTKSLFRWGTGAIM